jgi:hypothetical protein
MTAIATIVFLFSKFLDGAWVVVLAVPSFYLLFVRIHAYYARTAQTLGIGTVPDTPEKKQTLVVVPVVAVSRLITYVLSEALSLSDQVVAVTVVIGEGEERETRCRELEQAWKAWGPGVPLHILTTDYASIVAPFIAFIDELRKQHDEQIVVLIPVVVGEPARYRLLHNQMDLVLSQALRWRTDVVVARARVTLESLDQER